MLKITYSLLAVYLLHMSGRSLCVHWSVNTFGHNSS